MGNQRRLTVAIVVSVLTAALTVWDIRNWITIGKMGMAWDTGAPLWPYQAPDIFLKFINFPAYVIGVPLSNLLGLRVPKHHLLVFPLAIAFWLMVGRLFQIRKRGHARRTLLNRGAVLLAIVVLLSCASAVLWDAYRWWNIYGQSATSVWLVLLQLTTPAFWCVAAAFLLWRYQRNRPLNFASDKEMQLLGPELDEFVQNITPEEEPAFVSDEATVWDISLSTQDELIGRCFNHYGVQLRTEDLKLPLAQLLHELKRRRTK